MTPKHILLVGGLSGIGEATLAQLAKDDHYIHCACRRPDSLPDTVASKLFYDAHSKDSLQLPESLDGVVYCPGTINLKPFHRLDLEQFRRDMDINLMGAVDVLQQAHKSLKKSSSPSVVMFSSVAAGLGMPFHASIAAAKGAIEGLTRALAAEWAPKIRVNAIAPSLTDSKLSAPLLSSPEKIEASKKRHPSNSIGNPESIAALVSFLLSDQSLFMTGQVLGMDGGMSSLKCFK